MSSNAWGILLCLGLIAGGVWAIIGTLRLKRRCTAVTQARIAAVDVKRTEVQEKGSTMTRQKEEYTPVYAYYDTYGQLVQVRGKVSGNSKREYRAGDVVELRFNPAKPTEHYTGKFGGAAVLLGVVLIGLGVGILVLSFGQWAA